MQTVKTRTRTKEKQVPRKDERIVFCWLVGTNDTIQQIYTQ